MIFYGVYMIFISHARKDSPVIDVFVEKILRLGFGISDTSIFYTSHPDTDIPCGKYINGEIFTAIKKSDFLIIFLSKNYFDSAYCLCEMGAAKLLQDDKIFLFLLPELNYKEVEGVFSENMIKKIDQEGMDSFTDSIHLSCKNLILSKASASGRRIKDFLSILPEKIKKIEQPERVSLKKFMNLQEKHDKLEAELNQLENEFADQKKYIADLEKLKDAELVKCLKPPKAQKVEDTYEELRLTVQSNLAELSNDGKVSIFYFWRYGDNDASHRICKERLDLCDDIDESFFEIIGETFQLGESSEKIMDSINHLADFLTGDDLNSLCKQYGFKEKEWHTFRESLPSAPLRNLSYWRDNLFH